MNNKLSLETLGKPIREKGSQRFYNCPQHKDTKGHLGVNMRRGIYHCFKCGISGRVLGIERSLDTFRKDVEDHLFGPENEKKIEEVRLPREYQPITQASGMPFRYLEDRQVTLKEIRKYRIGYCSEGLYKERIIIPIYMNEKLRYFIGRTYTNIKPKYLNVKVPKDDIIFRTFSGRVDKAIICEGVFDALRIGKIFPAISLLGKAIIGTNQINSIVKSTKEAYILLDNDANPNAFVVAKTLNYYIPTKLMLLDNKKDPGSMSLGEIRKVLP